MEEIIDYSVQKRPKNLAILMKSLHLLKPSQGNNDDTDVDAIESVIAKYLSSYFIDGRVVIIIL